MLADIYAELLDVIAKFRAKEMSFHEYKSWMRSNYVGYELDYGESWDDIMDYWVETIEFNYPEEDWYELGCSLGDYIESAIRNEPRPLKLPENDPIIKEHYLRLIKEG